MGWIYAQTALINIVGSYDDKGISYDEIIKINNKTFRAKIEEHWEYIKPNSDNWSEKIIEERGGLYFLNTKFKENNKENLPDWKKDLEEMLMNQQDS
jgi:hypothetical protein